MTPATIPGVLTGRLNDRLSGAELCDIPAMPTCHCEERSDAAISRPVIRRTLRAGDCFVASLLAMTGKSVPACVRQPFRRLVSVRDRNRSTVGGAADGGVDQ